MAGPRENDNQEPDQREKLAGCWGLGKKIKNGELGGVRERISRPAGALKNNSLRDKRQRLAAEPKGKREKLTEGPNQKNKLIEAQNKMKNSTSQSSQRKKKKRAGGWAKGHRYRSREPDNQRNK